MKIKTHGGASGVLLLIVFLPVGCSLVHVINILRTIVGIPNIDSSSLVGYRATGWIPKSCLFRLNSFKTNLALNSYYHMMF
jgi:hypothetical protein